MKPIRRVRVDQRRSLEVVRDRHCLQVQLKTAEDVSMRPWEEVLSSSAALCHLVDRIEGMQEVSTAWVEDRFSS